MRQRLDHVLVDRGFFSDARAALGPIMAGNVVVEGLVVSAAGMQIKSDAQIHVRGENLRFVSRGGYKLERALNVFNFSVEGATVLDAGASTGGFTDCLLQRGAQKVFAVDAGFGQLRGKLAADSRVQVLEKTNIADLSPQFISDQLDLITLDLSYLSLLTALPALREALPGWADAICLVKPLYEGLAQDDPADMAAIEEVLRDLLKGLSQARFTVTNLCPSPILGGRGAVEFLLHLRNDGARYVDSSELVTRALQAFAADPPKSPEEVR